MKKNYILLAAIFLLTANSSFAQSILESLTPQPRQAYIRGVFSAVFWIQPNTYIKVDTASPNLSAAYEFNANLKRRGMDTCRIYKTDAVLPDTLTSFIALGANQKFLNDLLDKVPDQKITVSADYPGKEGYILDIMPQSLIIAGSDVAGLHYGIVTFFQLADLNNVKNGFFVSRIVDAPEFPNRWYYYPINFLVGANTTKAKAMVDTAAKYKFNGALISDFKFAFVDRFSKQNFGDNRYYDSVVSFSKYTKNNFVSPVLGCFSFGYSNDILVNNPNWASGLPVRNQKFVIDADSTVRLVPQKDVTLSNPGFEQYNGNNFPGYSNIDAPGTYTFADNQEKHSGNSSIRCENGGKTNVRIYKTLAVTPFTEYHIVGWIKTENANVGWGPLIEILYKNDGRSYVCDPGIPSTSNSWRKIEFTFNSLNNDQITIIWGSWGMNGGKVWWDDLLVEEVPFVNLIRRPGAFLTVAHPILTIVYDEGKDFDTLRDTKLGVSGNYDYYHQPPVFKILKGGKLKPGDTILVSYCHAIQSTPDQVMATMSDPNVYTCIEKEFRIVDSLLKPDTYFMSHDEIRILNWDNGDQQRQLTSGQILADNANKCYDIIKKVNPGATVWDWSDMFDEYHNAKPKETYYLVNGDFSGSADLINKNINICNWNSGNHDSSFKFFSGKGFSQMSAPFYDQDENNIRIWKEWTQNTPNFLGMMYTTWASNYNYMRHFGEYSWNHAPYIYHYPPTNFLTSLPLNLKIRGDKWDAGWQLKNVTLYYRTDTTKIFNSIPLSMTVDKDTTFTLDLPLDAKGVQYYFTATDNHNWVTKIPFGVPVYFVLGNFSLSVPDSQYDQDFFIKNISPNPARNNNIILEWYIGKSSSPVSISIINVLGLNMSSVILNKFEQDQNKTNIDVSKLPPGVYFVALRSGNDVKTAKFVK